MTEATTNQHYTDHRPDNHTPTEHQACDTEMSPSMFSPQDHTLELTTCWLCTDLRVASENPTRPTPSSVHPASRTIDPGSTLS